MSDRVVLDLAAAHPEATVVRDALFTLVVALLCVGVLGRAAGKRAGLLRAR